MARKILNYDRQAPDSYRTEEGARGEQVRADLEDGGIKVEVVNADGDFASTMVRDARDARNLAMCLLLWSEDLEA